MIANRNNKRIFDINENVVEYLKHITLTTHINIIVKECFFVQNILKSIILYGGYARGEGSWYCENNEYKPYNDYDILLVVKNRTSNEIINKLKKKIENKINIRWIDIGQITINELKKLSPSIYSYDLKYASKVIYGNTNILELIPHYDAKKIPLKEGEILYFTRLWTLLGSLDENGFKLDRKGEESRFFRNQMAKAILAVVDVILLQKGKYHSSYRERVKRFQTLFPDKVEMCNLSEWALEEKLYPKAPYMKAEDIKILYTRVHNLFNKEMYKLLTKYYKRNIVSPDDIEKQLKYSMKYIIRRFGWLMIRLNNRYNNILKVKLAQSYINAAYSDKIIHEYYLKKGIKYLINLDSSFSDNSTWDESRVKVAQLRMEL